MKQKLSAKGSCSLWLLMEEVAPTLFEDALTTLVGNGGISLTL